MSVPARVSALRWSVGVELQRLCEGHARCRRAVEQVTCPHIVRTVP